MGHGPSAHDLGMILIVLIVVQLYAYKGILSRSFCGKLRVL
jgi:hypothetical protein